VSGPRSPRLLVGLTAGILLAGIGTTVPVGASSPDRSYEVVSCDAAPFTVELPAGIDAECGLLTVPEDRGSPMAEDNRVVLPVVTVQASGEHSGKDPLGVGRDGSWLTSSRRARPTGPGVPVGQTGEDLQSARRLPATRPGACASPGTPGRHVPRDRRAA
jgi:hypothetical protein